MTHTKKVFKKGKKKLTAMACELAYTPMSSIAKPGLVALQEEQVQQAHLVPVLWQLGVG